MVVTSLLSVLQGNIYYSSPYNDHNYRVTQITNTACKICILIFKLYILYYRDNSYKS